MDDLPDSSDDPIGDAAKRLLGVDYLYPYQRLVAANAVDGARAAGLRVRWPGSGAGDGADGPYSAQAPGDRREDGAAVARQIVILPTGAGKSLCFQLPALLLERPTLVVYPILALMADQERRLAERGFAPATLRGGQDAEERRRTWNRIREGGARIVIANPEVLLTEASLRLLPEARIAHLVVDEAHCVSEWGESFRPSYLRIGEILEASKAPLATAFTATASPPVLEKIERYLFGGSGANRIVGNPDRPNIRYSAIGTLLRDRTVVDLVAREQRPCIVFCATRARTERLARQLAAERPSIETKFYHAGLSREEKGDVERWFFGSKDGVLTATTAYGMGVDKPDVRTVLHRDCPPTVEAYLQESGRAGRDGEASKAILLWGTEDEAMLARMVTGPDRARFSALASYARDASRCRREALLALMGAECAYCSGCDVCGGDASPREREYEALLSFFGRNRRRYGVDEAAGVIAERNANGWSPEEAAEAIERLIAAGALAERKGPVRKPALKNALWTGTVDPAPYSSPTSTSEGAAFDAFVFGGARRAGRERRAGRFSRAT